MQKGDICLNKALFWLLAFGVALAACPAWAEGNACAIPAHVSRHVLLACELASYPTAAASGPELSLRQMKALAIQGENPQVRYCALYALGESRSPQVTVVLVELLQDPDPRVRRAAAHGLGKLSDRSAVMPLIELLCRPGEGAAVRSAAVGSLGRLGDPRAVAVLTYHSQSKHAWVRDEASKALARLDTTGELQRAGR